MNANSDEAIRLLLDKAARTVMTTCQEIPELCSVKVAVIGGMALWRYVSYRTTQDVDLWVTAPGAPKTVKKLLRDKRPDIYEYDSDYFFVKVGSDKVQVDIVHFDATPFQPSSAITVADWAPNGPLPYITHTDLIAYKIYVCGTRFVQTKKDRDAEDARRLVINFTKSGGTIILSDKQKEAVKNGLPDLLKLTGNSEDWWKKKLGL